MTTAVRNFFRHIGGVIGLASQSSKCEFLRRSGIDLCISNTAVSNMLLNLFLQRKLNATLGYKVADDLLDQVVDRPLTIYDLPPDIPGEDQHAMIHAYIDSLRIIFRTFIPVAAIGLVCALIMPEVSGVSAVDTPSACLRKVADDALKYQLDRDEGGAPVRKRFWGSRLLSTYVSRRRHPSAIGTTASSVA
jgi:hypothetical protein